MGNQASSFENGETKTDGQGPKPSPAPGSMAEKRYKQRLRRLQAEAHAFTDAENSALQRLQTALASLGVETSGGLSWVECEDLKHLLLSGDYFVGQNTNRSSGGNRNKRNNNNNSTDGRTGRSGHSKKFAAAEQKSTTIDPNSTHAQRQIFRDEKAENVVLRAHNKTLLAEVRRLRSVLCTLDIAINQVAKKPARSLLYELRQRRAGTFPRHHDEALRRLRRKKMNNGKNSLNQHPLRDRAGLLLHRDFIRLLTVGHRIRKPNAKRSPNSSPSTSPLRPSSPVSPRESKVPAQQVVSSPRLVEVKGSTVLIATGAAASRPSSGRSRTLPLKLDRWSYSRWPMKCGYD